MVKGSPNGKANYSPELFADLSLVGDGVEPLSQELEEAYFLKPGGTARFRVPAFLQGRFILRIFNYGC
ncbi:hypothetical protein D1B31_11305 [Neobacillus notoginsengisoli]|uniref:Uncharacterized protein n=1 Tax=Neobacillus notoginsengisoli TaxID=1578198 RepID=A0A417YUD5_9BACI|nr:hypothetical protein D1B31_11305 [Neobacillus notoginsengisoli]